jgi:uncharacterized membrane protein
MGSGNISFAFIMIMLVGMAFGFISSMIDLIYNSIDGHEFKPTSFWLAIAFLIFTVFGSFALADNIKYDNKHTLKTSLENIPAGYKELKTFDIHIKDGETYLNAKNAKIISASYIAFDTEDGRHLETNAETLVEVHTEIIKE